MKVKDLLKDTLQQELVVDEEKLTFILYDFGVSFHADEVSRQIAKSLPGWLKVKPHLAKKKKSFTAYTHKYWKIGSGWTINSFGRREVLMPPTADKKDDEYNIKVKITIEEQT